MIKRFFIDLHISLKGGLDVKYLTLALKYLTKAVETITLVGPIIRGLFSIWKKKDTE